MDYLLSDALQHDVVLVLLQLLLQLCQARLQGWALGPYPWPLQCQGTASAHLM